MMKKLGAIALTATMMLSLIGCSKKNFDGNYTADVDLSQYMGTVMKDAMESAVGTSDYELKLDKETQKNELYIAVKSWDQSVVKTVSELWSFQMLRLYEIYVEEQMNLQILRKENPEDEQSAQAIDSERDMRLKKWEAVLDTMWREQLAKETKAEQEEKLWDLLWKL